jgi:hypothetical protein
MAEICGLLKKQALIRCIVQRLEKFCDPELHSVISPFRVGSEFTQEWQKLLSFGWTRISQLRGRISVDRDGGAREILGKCPLIVPILLVAGRIDPDKWL